MPMIVLPIVEEMVVLAKRRAERVPYLNNSIRKQKGKVIGCLGEIAVNYLLGGDLVSDVSMDYDIVYRGLKLEVKTKETTVIPQYNYEASVSDNNISQNCDVYVFCRILNDYSLGYLCGMMRREDFVNRSRYLTKGMIDGSNGFPVKGNCWNMYHYELIMPPTLLEYADNNGFDIIE